MFAAILTTPLIICLNFGRNLQTFATCSARLTQVREAACRNRSDGASLAFLPAQRSSTVAARRFVVRMTPVPRSFPLRTRDSARRSRGRTKPCGQRKRNTASVILGPVKLIEASFAEPFLKLNVVAARGDGVDGS